MIKFSVELIFFIIKLNLEGFLHFPFPKNLYFFKKQHYSLKVVAKIFLIQLLVLMAAFVVLRTLLLYLFGEQRSYK